MAGAAALDVSQYFAGASAMLPEMILGAGAALLLLVEAFARPDRRGQRPALSAAAILLASLLAALAVADDAARTLFSGMVVVDPFVHFFRVFAAVAGLLGVAVSLRSGELGRDNRAEYYALLLAAVLGMMLMASASDLVMVFVGVELVSLMSYVLAGYRRHDPRGAEAALKYVVYGGAASGAMLFGLSLIYGLTGHTQLALINEAVARLGETGGAQLALTAGLVLTFAGFCFKIAAVPLHMWSPDVYEGAPTPFTAFLSTGPKAAGFALLLRFFLVGFSDASAGNLLADVSRLPWLLLVVVVAILTMTVGNLAAIGQSNIKRFLAYSSVAHAGYALIGVAAFSRAGAASVLVYMSFYLLMNIGAFYAVIWVREKTGSELIADYRGLGQRAPLVAITLTLCFISLTGLPPLAGFIGKYKLFAAALERAMALGPAAQCAPEHLAGLALLERAGCALSGGGVFYALAILAVLNSAISLYYYFRVVRVMFLEKATDPTPLEVGGLARAILLPVAAALLFFGVYPTPIEVRAEAAIVFARPTLAEVTPDATPSTLRR